MNIIEEDLGKPLEVIFSYISERPIAAASLGILTTQSLQYHGVCVTGQVYRAKLRGSGEAVAVKVQRPGVEPIIYRSPPMTPLLAI